ncbi:MAG: hypothetical protein ACJ77K_04320 [Bacteroidia bacterium]
MLYRIPILVLLTTTLLSCSNAQTKPANHNKAGSIVKIEMNLSAFGVEADDVPSIDVTIDFKNDSSRCIASFYNPSYKGYSYSLSKDQMNSILELLKNVDLATIKKEYTTNRSDQARATTTIYSAGKIYKFDDYGLEAGSPLRELYKIVFRYK